MLITHTPRQTLKNAHVSARTKTKPTEPTETRGRATGRFSPLARDCRGQPTPAKVLSADPLLRPKAEVPRVFLVPTIQG